MPDKHTIYEFLVSNITDKLVQYLIDDHGYALDVALDKVYRSNTYKLLQLPETELYIQSPAYVYERLEREINPIYSEA